MPRTPTAVFFLNGISEIGKRRKKLFSEARTMWACSEAAWTASTVSPSCSLVAWIVRLETTSNSLPYTRLTIACFVTKVRTVSLMSFIAMTVTNCSSLLE